MITVTWKKGFGFVKADAQKCYDEITAIGESVTPAEIVAKARDESTELHKCFEWDDKIAGEKYREQQAGYVLRMLVIKEEVPPTDRPEIRVLQVTEPGQGYKRVELIVQKEDEYKALLARAYAELRAFKAKYSMLTELQEIFDLIK